MADTYAGAPTTGPVSAPSVFTHPPVRQHRDARGGSAVDDALAGDITLCSHSKTLGTQNFPKAEAVGSRIPIAASVMSATGLLATSVPQFLNYYYVLPVDCRRKAFILIKVAWPSPVIAIVGE
jgi:hypothetical protein